ncbi:MAG: 2-succinyl-5-enolpyruvyl-6-hydroxy-3-cyclohexene-1-carboxylic-acid synthase [Cyanobacteria bacterium M_surface_10_m2_179]|nr:2-succinyl-5-enolpyruvyl-6-hydroxy-3-cyclohexene-1-carboxylic-acid synthase [Cyanobacteria bacterium M_surface_10_m2_179]
MAFAVPATPAHGSSPAANLRAALVLLQALRDLGLRRLVLCPGSRSAPLAVAAGLLERQGLQLLTAVDERSAAFLAVGLGRADGLPAAVVTTSGTAVANLLPAVVEADHGAVPLLLLSADRPERLKGCGANQTVNQQQFLAPCCRWLGLGDPAGLAAMETAALQALAGEAWRAALGVPLGPVHLNLPIEEPLHISEADLLALIDAPPPAVDPLPLQPAPAVAAAADPDLMWLDPDRPGVVVVGPWRGPSEALAPFAQALLRWQQRSAWPVLADALSGLRGWPGLALVHGYDLLLAEGHQLPSAPQLLRLGSMPASRRLQQWISGCGGEQLLITENDPRNLDAGVPVRWRSACGLASWLHQLLPEPASAIGDSPSPTNLAWAEPWWAADRRLQEQLDQLWPAATPTPAPCCEPALARALSRALPAGLLLMLASSSPVRDWESFAAADAPQRPVFGFRGASGIDGTLSLATGLALAHGRAVLLTGDLALLHDANGWLWQRQLAAAGACLTVVLVDNGGGGIFEQLPIRAGAALDFERLFAMPQALDHSALATGYGIPSRRLEQLSDLAAGLAWAWQQPMALLHCCTDRQADAQLRHQLRRRMAAACTEPDAGHSYP